MIINKLILNNIGLYSGSNEFNLQVTDNENIVLIGGKNGSGKTTFLDSIKLCLYGSLLFNGDTTKYNKFIRKFIRNGEQEGEIELSISYYESNEKVDLLIKRSWSLKPRSIHENFVITKNGNEFKEVSKRYWQDFILEIIPYGLINLFFFDGEKIEHLAKDLNKTQVGNAIKSLLGVSSLEYLNTCMEVYKNKVLDSSNTDTSIKAEIEIAEDRQRAIAEELGEVLHAGSNLKDRIKIINDKVNHLKHELTGLGGNIINDYTALQKEKELLEENITSVENQIRDLAGTYLPLTLFTDGLSQLEIQLIEEENVIKHITTKELIEAKLKDIERVILEDTNQPALFSKINDILLNFDLPNSQVIHALSSTESRDVLGTIETVKKHIVTFAQGLKKQLHDLSVKLKDVDLAIEKAPKQDLIKPYLDKIKKHAENRKKLEIELAEIDKKHDQLYEEDEKLAKSIKELRAKIENNIKLEYNNKLLNKSINVLNQFKYSFISRRIKQLEKYLLENLQLLNRKTDIIDSLSIDPRTFQVTLFDNKGNKISKSRLSAGERQIFAISLLWALTMVSGRMLPTIIDTPLSRLDSDHRSNIVNGYFKKGSHQMIILSTDEEIDENLYLDLNDHISMELTLNYNKNAKKADISTNYFWYKDAEVSNEI